MSNSIKIDGLADEINGLIVNYGKRCTEVTKECVTKVAGSTLKKIKKNSPVKTGKYKKGWRKTVVKENSTSLVITVHDAKYSLVHLRRNRGVVISRLLGLIFFLTQPVSAGSGSRVLLSPEGLCK